MFSEIEIELALAAGILLLSLYCVGLRALLRPHELTLTQCAIAATGIFFGFGPIASYAVGEGSLVGEGMEFIVAAYEVVTLFILGLASVPIIARNVIANYKPTTIWDILSASLRLSWRPILALHAAAWGLRLIIARNYGIFFYGTGTGERILSMPYGVVVLNNILEFLAISAFIWAAIKVWNSRNKKEYWIALGILATGLFWAFIQGRRPLFIYSTFVYYGYACSVNKIRLRQIGTAMLVFGFVLLIGFPAFIRLRMSHEGAGADEDAFGHVYKTAVGASKISRQELDTYYRENMTERPLIIRFICKILASQSRFPVMEGEALMTSVRWAIPSALSNEKKNILMTEQNIQAFYYHPKIDTSLTWPATGCADYGLIGGLFIGVFLGTMILFMERLMLRILHPFPLVAISSTCALLLVVVNVECDPLELFSQIRTTLILYLVALTLRFCGIAIDFQSDEGVDDPDELPNAYGSSHSLS